MDSELLQYGIIFGLVAGLIVGAIPMIVGAVKGKIGLGFGGFFAFAIGGVILGLLAAVPIAGIFTFIVCKDNNQNKFSKRISFFPF